MKKSIYVFLAVLAVLAILMTGCENGGNNTKPKTVVTLDPTTLTLEVGRASKITATTDPVDVELTWTSSDDAVAFVNPIGTVTGMSAGTATITATAEDGGKATCSVTVNPAITSDSDVEVVGETLVHKTAKLVGVNHFGTDLGTTNADGSYTFNGTAAQYSGGGAQYNFPAPKANDTWRLSDYGLVEVFLQVTEGSVQVLVKKSGGNVDLSPYPSGSSNITLNTDNEGKYSYKAVITDAGSGIGFQRNQSGPATVKIEKVVFSKVTEYTVSFAGGGANISIQPIKVKTDLKVTLPYKPKWSGHTFLGWYDGENLFDAETLINKDYILTAKWADGDPAPVDMKLNLDTSLWGTLPENGAITGGSPSYIIPREYAETAYADGKLTITFDGRNRQRAIIPLNADQIYELMDPALTGATFRIVGTVARGTQGTLTNAQIASGELGFAAFRLHLADPTATSNWNGTETGKQTPFTGNTDPENDHLVEYRPFSSNKKAATLGFFVIQAMFKDDKDNPDSVKEGFPKVIITIESITIDGGDTTAE
ncbi:hypothetical protein R84B8_01083 [Treponema sp. R8-4-B8]